MSTPATELLAGGLPTGTPGDGSAADIAARSPLQLFWRRLKTDKIALGALVVIVLLILIAVFAPLIIKAVGAHQPNDQNTNALDDFGSARGPGGSYLMGTDQLGRDVFSRTLYGARVSLEVAFITTIAAVVIGVTIGMLAGYYRGWVDTVLSRTFDVLLAFPVLLLALGLGAACSFGDGCLPFAFGTSGLILILAGLLLAAVMVIWTVTRKRPEGETPPEARDLVWRAVPGLLLAVLGLVFAVLIGGHKPLIQPGLSVVIFIISLANIPYMARIIRGQVLSLREKEFVEAAQSLGASHSRIIFRHILPNLVAPILVYATLLVPQNILFEAALSFIGVGVQPPTASWGAMIADAVDIFDSAWWFMTFPGLALLITVLAFNLVGDGLQDALNPRRGR